MVMATLALAVVLVAAALQAAHAQGEGEVADRLDELSALVDRANRVNTILYVVSFTVGAALAGIAICATHSNTRGLRRQTENYEERTSLLREDIGDRLTPVLAWTLAGAAEERQFRVMGSKHLIVRIVNVGQAPAMRVASDVRHMLSVDGDEFSEDGRSQYTWGAILPGESIAIPVWLSFKAVEAAESGRGEFRADVELEYQSMGGAGHVLQMRAVYDGKYVYMRDADGGSPRARR